ncbi:hypothetical protein YA0032_05800 [Pseudomonas amygdali]|uniref:hypothetical protein n=1 Tax=Pseudomonas amygdali TaxID=47877 RepID=UPI0018E5C49B|nr:hypothetical protein [Pseudomonas amygdali]MBI6727661.1 hypothetical protein [Pseudomonas amygdali]MBI6810700.1 hypothetical protein [Pseudomonas amygdali]
MTQAKERPILFSAPMMRAILEGRKTVTRRVCKPQPSANAHTKSADGSPMTSWWETGKDIVRCPYGQPGERLWVREAWQADAQVNAIAPRELSHGEPIQYPADGSSRQTGCSMITPGKTRPSIHMPRWVSRILLEITDVRVERLQDISEEQAKAEGPNWPVAEHLEMAWRVQFRTLWESINGAENWNANPWVWVVEFKHVTP